METLHWIDVSLTCILLAIFWHFWFFRDTRRITAAIISVLYIVSAGIDVLSGRAAGFYMSMFISLVYVWISRKEKKEWLTRKKAATEDE